MTARALAAWPDAVWGAAVLRGLDGRARGEIAAAGKLKSVRRGETLYRAGEPADSLYVVAEGAIAVRAVRRGDVEATLVRDARRGDAFGEEAMLGPSLASRRMEAHAVEVSVVASIPSHVLRRALTRSDADENVMRAERTLRRAATKDLLRTMSFARALADRELDALLDAVDHVHLARGEALFHEGDPAAHAYLVASGMLQLQTEDAHRVHVRAYVTEGDLLGDEDVLRSAPRGHAAVASGASWVLAIPRDAFARAAAANPAGLAHARRVKVAHEDAARSIATGARTTQHVFRDLYRLHVAKSLLVIDQDACVRCGHCAWSCGEAHEGVSRLVRRGDKIVSGAGANARPLLVPNSCQHCENPSCMPDCPTGAIGRDLRGEVFIREDRCTGCGSCAKGCPWDNIQLAPRSKGSVARPKNLSPEVAVKCDLCHGLDGPACVAACPTEAIARVDPHEAIPELRVLRNEAPASPIPRASPAWPWVTMGAGLAPLVARVMPRDPWASGWLAGAVIAILAAYVVAKRWPRRSAPRLRPWLVTHLAIGAFGPGVVIAHAGARVPPNAAGALQVAVWAALLTGSAGALIYRFVPKALTRIERGGALPEDLAAKSREIDERAFAALTGRSDLIKTIYARILRPYARAWLGGVALVASGRTLRQEEDRVRARIDAALEGRGGEKRTGLEEVVRAVVERRAIGAQRVLQAMLRAWLPLHVALAAIAAVLLMAHLAIALAYR